MWQTNKEISKRYHNWKKSIKQGSTKTQINKVSPTSTLGFGCSPHKKNCDIF